MINFPVSSPLIQGKQPVSNHRNTAPIQPARKQLQANRFGNTTPEKSLFTKVIDRLKAWWHSLLVFLRIEKKADTPQATVENTSNPVGEQKQAPDSLKAEDNQTTVETPKTVLPLSKQEQTLKTQEDEAKARLVKIKQLGAEFAPIPLSEGLTGKAPTENTKKQIKKIAAQLANNGSALFENFTKQEAVLDTLENEHQKNCASKRNMLNFNREQYEKYNKAPDEIEKDLLHQFKIMPQFMAKQTEFSEQLMRNMDNPEKVATLQKEFTEYTEELFTRKK